MKGKLRRWKNKGKIDTDVRTIQGIIIIILNAVRQRWKPLVTRKKKKFGRVIRQLETIYTQETEEMIIITVVTSLARTDICRPYTLEQRGWRIRNYGGETHPTLD